MDSKDIEKKNLYTDVKNNMINNILTLIDNTSLLIMNDEYNSYYHRYYRFIFNNIIDCISKELPIDIEKILENSKEEIIEDYDLNFIFEREEFKNLNKTFLIELKKIIIKI
jgi:hypothetical protein